jgi:regulator of cell morphogenesis and NO signaling
MHAIMDIRERTVGELAAQMPLSIRVFEAWKIDYCGGGQTPLPAACAAAGKNVDAFIEAVEKLVDLPDGSTRDWTGETLTSMSANIVSMYHAWTREELEILEPLADKVLSVHGERRPELAEVVTISFER